MVEGGRTDLYGGTEKAGTCDKEKLINYLEATPDKAAGWATVVGIDPSQIRSFVTDLTPLILRSDTRVTNHGWSNGEVTTVVAVIQAGTAVLVDDDGVPVVKCFCGHPLSPPPAVSETVYVGQTWPTWNPQSITVIQQNVTVIENYTVVNVTNNQTFVRPAGSDGSVDTPAAASGTGNPTPSQPASPTVEPTPEITSRESAAQAVKTALLDGLRRCAARLGVAEDLERNLSKYTFTATKLDNPSMWQVNSVGEGDTYKWNVNAQTRKVVAAHPLAARISQLCPGDVTG